MKRIDVIRQIMCTVTDELVIATTGYISRELFWVKDRPEDFYMCGSMGYALPIGLGVALHTDRNVIVLDGDGAALMCLNALVIGNRLRRKNLRYIILDNGVYDSTGGQPTCAGDVDFTRLVTAEVIKVDPGHEPDTPRVSIEPDEILGRFMRSIQQPKGSYAHK